MEKRQASLNIFFGKRRRRLDLEDITPTADTADESNVDDQQRASGAAEAVKACNQRHRRRADRHLKY